MKKDTLIAIGEALIDFIPNETGCDFENVTSFYPKVGGAPANVCGAFRVLGGKSKIITQLGDDPFGRKIEKELKNYSVEVSKEGITFVVTNTYVDDVPEEQNPTNTPKPTLPQTGQLWWPVPVLLCAGLLLLIVGLVRSRRSKTNEK